MEIFSSHSIRDRAPKPDKNARALNPGSWPQHWREAIFKEIAPAEISTENTLSVIEHAICVLDAVRIGQRIEPDMLATTLRELRATRVEYLKAL